eukprot:Gb_30835 [translate_table: standard]
MQISAPAHLILVLVLLFHCCSIHALAKSFDFYYFVQQISDLVNELNKYWGSLSCPSSDGHRFWGHEWTKHGTCSVNLDEHSYFQAALSLRHKIDLLGALKSAGIEPDGSEYSVSDIKKAIRQSTGEDPVIDCNRSGEGNHQLYQIYVCVDKSDASTLIRCPVVPHSNCPSTVVFSPFNGDEEETNETGREEV